MAVYTQANRSLAITTPLGKDALLLQKFTGTEAISTLFSFQLDLLAEQPVPLDKLVGQKATLTLRYRDRPQRYVNGLVSRFSQGARVRARDGKTPLLCYQAELVPRLWLLTKRLQTRIF